MAERILLAEDAVWRGDISIRVVPVVESLFSTNSLRAVSSAIDGLSSGSASRGEAVASGAASGVAACTLMAGLG